jgi:hypothetical protein
MAEHAEVWNLHLIYQLSHIPPGFDDDVHRKVRAIEGVTRVAVVPSPDAATHLAFSTGVIAPFPMSYAACGLG